MFENSSYMISPSSSSSPSISSSRLGLVGSSTSIEEGLSRPTCSPAALDPLRPTLTPPLLPPLEKSPASRCSPAIALTSQPVPSSSRVLILSSFGAFNIRCFKAQRLERRSGGELRRAWSQRIWTTPSATRSSFIGLKSINRFVTTSVAAI